MKRKFYTEKWFMWLMLFVFAPIGIALLFKYHRNGKLKTSLISVLFIFFIEIGMYTSVGASNSKKVTSNLPKENTEKVTYKKLSASDREILKMKYSDFNDAQKDQFSEIENKYDNLSDEDQTSISDDYQRLESEKKDAKEAEIQSNQNNNTQNSSTNQPAQQSQQQNQQQNTQNSQSQQNT